MVHPGRTAAGGGPVEPKTAKRPRLLLASRSPRRRMLLAEHGLEHDAEASGVDDSELMPGRVTPQQWAAALAYLKAAAGADRALGRAAQARMVLGADTICIQDGEVIGQPRDSADAGRIIGLFENCWHEVVTGVALVWGEGGSGGAGGTRADPARPPHRSHRRIFIDRARVRVGKIGPKRIDEYVASGQWRGKAGAYNLSERLEAGWPIEYEGDPGTITGLPVRALVRVLDSLAPPGAGAGKPGRRA
jgi:septum formation protein